MGRRSRKRTGGAAARERARPPAERVRGDTASRAAADRRAEPGARPRRRARIEEAPKAPWSPFPLVELCILIGLVLIVIGFVTHGSRGHVILALGLSLVSLSALEVSIREHFAGYRSHSMLLAGAAALASVVLLSFFTSLPRAVPLAIGVAIFGASLRVLRAAFKRRAGGLSFRA